MNKKNWYIIGFMLLLQLAFLVLQLCKQNYLLDDSLEYITTADNMINEGMIYCGDLDEALDPALYTKRPPAYPAFLALSRLFTKSFVPVIVLQLLLSLLAMILMFKVFDPGKHSYLIVFLMLLFFPAQFIYSNMIMSEILFQCTIMLAVYFLWTFLESGNRKFLWFFQLFLIAGILVKPVLYLFIVPNILLFLARYIKTRRRLTLVSSIFPLMFIIIYGGINQQRTGYYHISSIQQINLVDYNLYYFNMHERGKDSADLIRDNIHEKCFSFRNFPEQSKCLSKTATSMIKDELPAYLVFHGKGMLRFFIDPGRFDIYNFLGIESNRGRGFLYHLNDGGLPSAWKYLMGQPFLIILLLFFIAMINVLRALGFIFYLFNRKIYWEFRLFLFLLVGVIAFATGPLGASRFLLPVVLILTGSAAYQYAFWIRKIKTPKAA